MRLKREHIQRLSELILRRLKSEKMLVMRVSEDKVLEGINKAITADLRAEDDLEEQAKDLLEKFRPQIRSGEMDERQALFLIKKQLAKEKKMVL